MKVNDILFESLTDVVYHATDVISADKIVKSNKFILTPSKGISSEEHYSNKLFFLSTTRSRAGGSYHNDKVNYVLFVLDGRKLSYNHSAMPVNYWAGMTIDLPNKHEAEDRLFSDKPEITNADRYIERVDIIWSDKAHHIDVSRRIYKLYYECKRHRIPVRIYESRKDWQLNTDNYVKDLERIKQFNKRPDQEDVDDDKRYTDMKMRHQMNNDKLYDKATVFAILNKIIKTGKTHNRLDWNVIHKYAGSDSGGKVLSSDFHNASRAQGTRENNNLNELIMTMKSKGLYSPEDVSRVLSRYIRLKNTGL